MTDRVSIGVSTLVIALLATIVGAGAFDESKYPDLRGEW